MKEELEEENHLKRITKFMKQLVVLTEEFSFPLRTITQETRCMGRTHQGERCSNWFFLWMTHGLVLVGDRGAIGILLTSPQEHMAFERAIPEAAGTVPSESEKEEHMQIQDG